jgi:hypothetical protein
MDSYDEFYNYNGEKYNTYEIFYTFLFIIFYEDQNIG